MPMDQDGRKQKNSESSNYEETMGVIVDNKSDINLQYKTAAKQCNAMFYIDS